LSFRLGRSVAIEAILGEDGVNGGIIRRFGGSGGNGEKEDGGDREGDARRAMGSCAPRSFCTTNHTPGSLAVWLSRLKWTKASAAPTQASRPRQFAMSS